MIDSLAPHISQAERLALCPVSPFVTIREDEQDESEETARLNNHPLSARNAGFVMPSRFHMGTKANPARRDSSGDFITIGDNDEDKERIETACFLPSARNRGAVYAELRGMGVSMEG